MSAEYNLLTVAFETKAGAVTTANPSLAGYWLRTAVAAEVLAGAATTANANTTGYILRMCTAVLSFTTQNPAGHNTDYLGYIGKAVHALELANATTYTGSLIWRLTQAITAFASGAVVNAITTEGGDFLTTEAGDTLIQE